MKHLLLFALFIPTLLWAQDDAQYLAGAVPEENGKVIFTKEISAPSLSSDQIYDRMLAWAKDYFNTETSRVVYSDKSKGDIAAVGESYLVFANTALSLDRTLMSYRVTIECRNQDCIVKVNGIRYEYNVSYQREPEKYTAEEWIADKYALNKNKNKLNRGNGKFRVKTVNFINELFDKASAALGVVTPVAPTEPSVKFTPLVPAVSAPAQTKEGYVAFAPDKIPGTLLQLLPESAVQLTPDKQKDRAEKNGTWKGIGTMFGKSIASISVETNSPAYKNIGNDGTYSISFFKKGEAGEAWLIIDCRKQGETADGQQKTIIGEILNVWVK